MTAMQIHLPFNDQSGECLGIGPSQGLVYAIDSEIVIKMPFQYAVVEDPDEHHLLELSLRSFISLEKELAVYATLKAHPHPNFVRRLETGQSDCLFLERLEPLERAWPRSTEPERRRWALELLDAVSWLEAHGWADGDLAVRNLGVDGSNRLKLFDFGSAVHSSHPDYAIDVVRDHFELATCLHYILSGIDPLKNLRSYAEVKEVRAQLAGGHGVIGPGAEVLADIIHDGWTGRSSSTSFGQIYRRVSCLFRSIAGAATLPERPESHYQRLESRCRDWLGRASRNARFQEIEGYVRDCKAVGLDADLDVWR
ncbi:Protein kinase domain-containing protein [Colletotrichum higginsianum IMI 349063]|uniref:Protein kinase domain-containing protein n=1 Tax=Colletotrichum higginsianum (strain IMI 349063) TaxID=759273 RepID=A0A1B7YWQ0_COLHI|nr:Protein kinase domain-containing protein [Colletotrichum higginsianum IMI 349063]OBR16394.1 Protein kinase domain-containing protein [Colletotrichum higginsianum IMI 349063]